MATLNPDIGRIIIANPNCRYPVECAKLENKSRVKRVLRRCCPKEYFIYELEPMVVPAKKFTACRWIVKYKLIHSDVIPEPDAEIRRLYEILKDSTPFNAKIMAMGMHYGPPQTCVVEYGVKTCKCPNPVYAAPLPPNWGPKMRFDFGKLSLT